jgi:hypothetical protein
MVIEFDASISSLTLKLTPLIQCLSLEGIVMTLVSDFEVSCRITFLDCKDLLVVQGRRRAVTLPQFTEGTLHLLYPKSGSSHVFHGVSSDSLSIEDGVGCMCNCECTTD